MRLSSILLAGLLVCAAARVALAADDLSPLVGRPVVAVTVKVLTADAPPEVLSLVSVKLDRPLSLEDVQASVQSLVTVGRFESVKVLATNGPTGVALDFELVPRRLVDDVAFTGDTGLPPDDLKARVKQQYGVIPATVRADAMARSVRTVLVDQGFLSATTTATIADSPSNPERSIVVVDVHAGPRASVGKVDITGSSPLSKATVIEQTGAIAGAPYRPRAIDDALVKLKATLRARTYYQAEAVVDTQTASADGRTVDLVIHVDAGPLVLGPFFSGDPRPSGNVDELVPMKIEQSVDDDLLDDATARIEALLRRDGFRDAKAPYTKTQTPRGLVVSFAITRGPLYRIGTVSITGNAGVPLEVVQRLFGVASGEPFSADKINVGLLTVRADYLKRGYYQVTVAPPTLTEAGKGPDGGAVVNLAFSIGEGPQAHVADVRFSPESPHVPVAALDAAMREKPGDPYLQANSSIDQSALQTLYQDRGFPNAHVAVVASASADHRAMTLTVTIDEGTQVFVQDIRVLGNHRVDTPAVLDAMPLKVGQPLGAAAIQRSRQNIQETFALRSVDIVQEPVLNDPTRAHVIVTVEESPATTLAWGGGVLVDRRLIVDASGTTSQGLDFGPRGSFAVTRQNVGGRNRELDFFSQAGVRTNPNSADNNFGFAEYLVRAAYVEHRAFQSNIDLTASVGSQRDVQTDFNFLKQGFQGTMAYRPSRRLSVTGEYALDFTKVFDFNESIPADQILAIDRLFPQVRLSTLTESVLWDQRNDPIAPSNGTLTNAEFEVAPKAIGSQVGFIKGQFQVSGYRAIDARRRFVAAARAWLGLAHGFQTEEFLDATGAPVLNPNTGQPIFVAALPASERFFAGGASSVRGFDQDVLGVPSIITADGLSLGGNGLVVLNLELRTRVMQVAGRDFGVVTFIDAGNVFLNASDTSLTDLRGTVGLGFRYNSPLGPIRLDYGFKLSRQPFGNGTLEPGWTWHLSVGEAF